MSGPNFLAYASVALTLMCAGLLAIHGYGEEGWRVVIRATARTSLVLFSAAYVASSLRTFWRSDATKWLLRNRRYVGLSYAVSHTLHLGAILTLARVAPDFRFELGTLIGGGIAYVCLYLMALTSNDRAVAALGLDRWRRLHRLGMHYNWFIFFQSFARRALTELFYLPYGLLVIADAVLRFAAWRKRKRPTIAVS
jgi:DMSO/TMAO reductase YedYZ heme-binding membrane subunit